jgi:hypothetical protein
MLHFALIGTLIMPIFHIAIGQRILVWLLILLSFSLEHSFSRLVVKLSLNLFGLVQRPILFLISQKR